MTRVEIDTTPVDADKASFYQLFEARKAIYPAKVRGVFRRTKWLFMFVLLAIYYLTPWVRWHRGEGAPDQAVLIDVVGRKFYFFFIEIWPQEVFYFTGILLIAALGLFFATTLFGRVWCGFACPQTVWTDLFLHVERFFEGDRHNQVRLAKAPWNFNKIWRKAGKHISWLLIGLATGGAWVFYFQDAPTLWADMMSGHFSFVPTFWMVFLTFSTYLMAGFAREQVCTYMCPYARFQGAMFDEESLLVTYDKARGEPRGNGKDAGDCVDCGRCVAVCPMGIDIRDGQQYRCINCGLCVDACDTVMRKLERPEGLIRYNTLNNTIPAKIGLAKLWKVARFVRPRTLYYATIMLAVGGVMLWSLLNKNTFEMNVLHQRNPLYVVLSDRSVRNTFTVRIINKLWHEQAYTLAADKPGFVVHASTGENLADGRTVLRVKPGKVAEFTVFVDRKLATLETEREAFKLMLTSDAGEDDYETVFISPELE